MLRYYVSMLFVFCAAFAAIVGDAMHAGNLVVVPHDNEHRSRKDLFQKLLRKVGDGTSTCKALVDYAQMLGGTELQDASGPNSERNLHRWVGRQPWRSVLPSTYTFRLPVQQANKRWIRYRMHAALLPHEVVHSIYEFSFPLFEHLFTGGADNLLEWWRGAERGAGEWYADHPVMQQQPDPRMRFLFGHHGDDAGVHSTSQTLVVTWGSIAQKLPVLDSRILFTMIHVQETIKGNMKTMHEIYSVLQWSFEALSAGKFPASDHRGKLFSKTHHPERFKLAGKDLAGGMRGAWAEMRGDWKYLVEALRLTQYYSKNYIYATSVGHIRKSPASTTVIAGGTLTTGERSLTTPIG